MSEIDYEGLPFDIQRKIDQLAYKKYYNSCFIEDSQDIDELNIKYINPILTFNNWHGTDIHKRGIIPFLRKYKLEKIKKTII
jgi:hypothetical protein